MTGSDGQQEREAHDPQRCDEKCPLHIGQCEHVCDCAAYIAAGL